MAHRLTERGRLQRSQLKLANPVSVQDVEEEDELMKLSGRDKYRMTNILLH